MATYQEIIDGLSKGAKVRNGMVSCPAHDDFEPSCKISRGHNETPLFKCHGGCSQEEIMAALQELGLWGGKPIEGIEPRQRSVAKKQHSKKKYSSPAPWERPKKHENEYRDENGKLSYQNVEFSDGLNPRFMRRMPDPDNQGRWVWRLDGLPPLPFMLPELIESKSDIFIAEGEKDVRSLQSIGVTATSLGSASGSWHKSFVKWFSGRKVFLIPDNDNPGRKHMAGLALSMKDIASEIKIINLPDLENKQDVSDWIEKGNGKDELVALTESLKATQEVATRPEPPDLGSTDTIQAEETDHERLVRNESEVLIDWIHQKESGAPFPTMTNIKLLLQAYGIHCRYNIVSKEVEINVPGKTYQADNRRHCSLKAVESLAIVNRMPITSLEGFLVEIADNKSYNPVSEWISHKKWDGVDRIDELTATLGAKDTVQAKKMLWKWLISGVAAMFEPNGVAARGVLVLQGSQSIGKTWWFKQLVGENSEFFLEGHTLDPKDKDSVKSALSRFIVELGEIEATFKKADIASFKSFIGRKSDSLFLRYSRTESVYPRRTIFCGTVNPEAFLNDPTGSSRIWTIACTEDLDSYHKVDVQQVWAQALIAYIQGEKWWLEMDEVKLLAESNRLFESASPFEELIVKHYGNDSPIMTKKTATEICIELGYKAPTWIQKRECGDALRKVKGEPTRSGGRQTWDLPEMYNSGGVWGK